MGRRRKQDVLGASLELLGLMLKLFFTLLAAIIKAVVQIISALAGLLKKKQPHTSKQATFRIGSGRQIYEGLKKEYAGPTGKTAKKYFLECCARTAITSNLSPQLLNYIRSENLKGRRAESIATSVLRKLPCYGKEDVERMVRSVVGMAETAFDRARAEDLGLEWYTWSTCCDARVRDSHRNMEGVLVSWNDPPSPEELIGDASQGKYHAGEGEECRCDARSILGLDGINWPARVHRNGRIVSMNRKDFQRLSGIQ